MCGVGSTSSFSIGNVSSVSPVGMWYSSPPPAPRDPVGGSSVSLLLYLPILSSAPITVFILFYSLSSLTLVAPLYPRNFPLINFLPLPPFRGFLCLPVPPRSPLPLAPASDITHKDEGVGTRTGGGETGWQNAGGSMLHAKCPRRPLTMAG